MRTKNPKRILKRKLSVSMSPAEEKIVNTLSREMGYYNFSHALRQIIREWHAAQAMSKIMEINTAELVE